MMHPIEHFTLARAWEGLTDDEFFTSAAEAVTALRDGCRVGAGARSG
jgi:hypothetical protein